MTQLSQSYKALVFLWGYIAILKDFFLLDIQTVRGG
jgi:hypothetical protein